MSPAYYCQCAQAVQIDCACTMPKDALIFVCMLDHYEAVLRYCMPAEANTTDAGMLAQLVIQTADRLYRVARGVCSG